MKELKCSSCDKQRDQLFPRNSKLIPSARLYMCRTCIEGGFEPRPLIIIYGRANGLDSIREYLSKNLYVGDPILASDLA
jgi:hypothetical protein